MSSERTSVVMEPIDVECPKCDAPVCMPCVNPMGGLLASKPYHDERREALLEAVSMLRTMGQGQLLATYRAHTQALQDMSREWRGNMSGAKVIEQSLRRRKQQCWDLLDRKPQVVLRTFGQSEDSDPQPQLISCPECFKPAGEPCFSGTELGQYHISRIRQAP